MKAEQHGRRLLESSIQESVAALTNVHVVLKFTKCGQILMHSSVIVLKSKKLYNLIFFFKECTIL